MNVSGTMNSATGHTSTSTRTGNFNDGLYDRAGARPDLDLDFARTKSLRDRVSKEDLITFTRSSGTGYGATYVDKNGLVKVAPVNWIFDSENLSTGTYSVYGDFEGAVSANAGTSPSGNSSYAFIGQGTTGRHTLAIRPPAGNNNFLIANNTRFVISFFIKRLSGDSVERYVAIETANYSTWTHTGNSGRFDLETGTRVSDPYGSGSAHMTSGIEDVGDGWYRIHMSSITGTTTNSTGFYLNGTNSVSNGAPSVTLTSSQGWLVWGVQVEEGSVPTTYIPTSAQRRGAPRFTHDPVTKESKGLLIEQQTINYVKNNTTLSSWLEGSVSITTDNSITTPDGTTGAAKVTADNGTGTHYAAAPQITGPANTTQIRHSVFLKYGNHRYVDIYGNYNNWMKSGTGVRVDLLNGTASTVGTSSTLTAVEEVKQFSNGWIKVTVKADHASGVTPSSHPMYLWFAGDSSSSTPAVSGIENQYFYAWGGQTETGSNVATSTIINETTGSITRSPDLASIDGDNFGTYRANLTTQTNNLWFINTSGSGPRWQFGSVGDAFEFANLYAYSNPIDGKYNAALIDTTILPSTRERLKVDLRTVHNPANDYVFSMYVKAVSNPCRVQLNTNAGMTGQVNFNLITNAVDKSNASAVAEIQNVGADGWKRIIWKPHNTGNWQALNIFLRLTADNAGRNVGTGDNKFYIYGPQIEEASAVTPLIPSTDTFTNRQSNATFVDGNGIIRKSLLNHVPNSEDYNNATYYVKSKTDNTDNISFTLNNKVAPDGTLTAHTPSQNMPMWGSIYWKNTESGGGTAWDIIPGTQNFTITTEWKRFSHTFQMPTNARLTTQQNYRLYPMRNVHNGIYYIYTENTHRLTLIPGEYYTYSVWCKLIDGITHIWGAQVVKGSEAGDYHKTTGTPSGPPRYSHDPDTLTPTGLYLEPASANLLPYSEDFSNSAWNKSNTVLETDNTETNPDGTLGARYITANSNNTVHRLVETLPNIGDEQHTFSVFVKPKSSQWIQLEGTKSDSPTKLLQAKYNVVTGAFNGSITGTNFNSTAYPNGWYRVSITSVATSNGDLDYTFRLGVLSSTGGATFAGTGNESLYVWGAQVEESVTLSSYIRTTGEEANRNADIFTSTATEVLDKDNGTKPAFYTKNGLSAFCQFDNGKTNSSRIFEFGTGTTMHVSATMTTQNKLGSYQPSDVVAHLTAPSTALIDGENKLALRYAANDLKLFTNGNGGPADGSVATNPSTKLTLGDWSQVSSPTNHRCIEGTINRLTIWKTPLPDHKLEKLTS